MGACAIVANDIAAVEPSDEPSGHHLEVLDVSCQSTPGSCA